MGLEPTMCFHSALARQCNSRYATPALFGGPGGNRTHLVGLRAQLTPRVHRSSNGVPNGI